MTIIHLIIWSIVLYVILQFITYGVMIQDKEPPKSVRVAGIAEAAFGTMIWGTLWFVHHNNYLKIFLMLLGLFWISIAISLYKASKIGRTICLILSIVRVPTIIGAVFSLLSIYELYFTQESRDYFNKTNLVKNNKQTDA